MFLYVRVYVILYIHRYMFRCRYIFITVYYDYMFVYYIYTYIYRVIHKSLRDFRTRLRNNQDRHGRERGTPSFFPTLQVLDMCSLGNAADVNPVIKFLRHAL